MKGKQAEANVCFEMKQRKRQIRCRGIAIDDSGHRNNRALPTSVPETSWPDPQKGDVK